jgi:hypothetical protein
VGFVVDKVALGQVFLCILWFSPESIIPLLLHIHSYIMGPLLAALPQRHGLTPSKKKILFDLQAVHSSIMIRFFMTPPCFFSAKLYAVYRALIRLLNQSLYVVPWLLVKLSAVMFLPSYIVL